MLELYHESHSFHSYASEFISFARLSHYGFSYTDIEPPTRRRGWDFPLSLKVGLGSIVANGSPLPDEWALSWLRCHPDMTLRTPAVRCADEFTALFKLRYRKSYQGGINIRRNKTSLSLTYHPASSSLDSVDMSSADQLPDVTRLNGPFRKLQKLAEEVTSELDPLQPMGRTARRSRQFGRHCAPTA